jgi:hypothetical protein
MYEGGRQNVGIHAPNLPFPGSVPAAPMIEGSRASALPGGLPV